MEVMDVGFLLWSIECGPALGSFQEAACSWLLGSTLVLTLALIGRTQQQLLLGNSEQRHQAVRQLPLTWKLVSCRWEACTDLLREERWGTHTANLPSSPGTPVEVSRWQKVEQKSATPTESGPNF